MVVTCMCCFEICVQAHKLSINSLIMYSTVSTVQYGKHGGGRLTEVRSWIGRKASLALCRKSTTRNNRNAWREACMCVQFTTVSTRNNIVHGRRSRIMLRRLKDSLPILGLSRRS